ncbi:MAG: hypothetical protein ABIQ89_02750 [Candidatus Saccharimonadales bacterium]
MNKDVVKLAKAHFGLVAAYAIFILASDAWGLVTRQLTSERWLMFGVLLVVTTVVWLLARGNIKNPRYYQALVVVLVLADIGLATFAVYTERGMASRGVALYAIPIVASAVLLSRTAIFGTAALCTAAYIMTATRYFYIYFNEGYKIELYSTIGLYSAGFFILATMLWISVSAASRKH